MPQYDLNDFIAEVEYELDWRWKELDTFRREIARAADPEHQNVMRRAFVTFLYAHFEGACKLILSAYVRVINGFKLRVDDAHAALAAAAWSDIWYGLRGEKKVKFFRNTLPDDAGLHRFGREVEFVERIWDAAARTVEIDSEEVVVTDSNLKPEVLQKILYRLGMDPAIVRNVNAELNKLLNFRNRIAHGEPEKSVTDDDCKMLEGAVRDVLKFLRESGEGSITEKLYLRKRPTG